MFKRLLLAIIALGSASQTTAHPAPFSYIDFHLDNSGVRGVLVVHDFDAAHELQLAGLEVLLAPDVARQYRETLIRIMDSRLHIRIDAHAATPTWGGIEVLADRQSLRLPFELSQHGAGTLEVDAALFPYDPNHSSFINVYEDSRLKHQAILDTHTRTLTYYTGSAQGRWAVVRTFIAAGIEHIFIGIDHILFLLGLLLLGGSLWRLATIVTSFTLGHSITLSLAALGIVRIAPHIVEPAIALSIVVVGVDNLLVRRKETTKAGTRMPNTGTGIVPEDAHSKDVDESAVALRSLSESGASLRDLRPWLAAAFGLIHGFGFASVLLEFGLPREALGWSLAAFNVGVEFGQLAIVVVIAGTLALLRRCSAVLAERSVLFGSIVVIVAGTYWFIQRIGIA